MHKTLLVIDGAVNLALGSLLLFFPGAILEFFGLPPTDTYFYVSILGAVIFGIGIALFLELWCVSRGVRGLGLGGAIAINFSGAGALVTWLLYCKLDIPIRGYITLWVVAIIVLGIGFAEIASRVWKYES